MPPLPVVLADIEAAAGRIRGHAHRTPVLTSSTIDRQTGRGSEISLARGSFRSGATMKNVPGKTLGLVGGLSTFFVLAPSEAFAYIDPGTGSFIFQAIAGALIGLAFFVRSSWDRIRERVRQFFGPPRGD